MQIDPHNLIQDGYPHVVKDGQQEKAAWDDQACRGGKVVGGERPTGKSSWGKPGLQGRAAGGNRADRGE